MEGVPAAEDDGHDPKQQVLFLTFAAADHPISQRDDGGQVNDVEEGFKLLLLAASPFKLNGVHNKRFENPSSDWLSGR